MSHYNNFSTEQNDQSRLMLFQGGKDEKRLILFSNSPPSSCGFKCNSEKSDEMIRQIALSGCNFSCEWYCFLIK